MMRHRNLTDNLFDAMEPRTLLSGLPWNSPATPVTPTASAAPVAADFDLDGKIDLASYSNAQIHFLKGRGDGTFEDPVSTTLNARVVTLAVGRFDGDARPDLVDAVTLPGRKLLTRTYYFDPTAGAFKVGARFVTQNAWTGGGNPRAFEPQVVAANSRGGWRDEFFVRTDTLASTMYEFRVVNRTTIASNGTVGVNVDLRAAKFADFDGNGIDELWFVESNALKRWSFDTFQQFSATMYTSTFISDFAFADFNRDGRLDIFLRQQSPFSSQREPLMLIFGGGRGIFTSRQTWNFPSSLNFAEPDVIEAVRDVNNDGRLDIILHDYTTYSQRLGFEERSRMVLLLDDGSGGWIAETTPIVSRYSYTGEIPQRGRFSLAHLTSSGNDLIDRSLFSGPVAVSTSATGPFTPGVLGGSLTTDTFNPAFAQGVYVLVTANSVATDFGGGIRRVEVIFDRNNNGLVDAGEEVFGTADGSQSSENVFRVAAALPADARTVPVFNVLARAIGIDGSVSDVVQVGNITWPIT